MAEYLERSSERRLFVRASGKRTLLEEDDMFRIEPEVGVLLEEGYGFLACRAAGHDVPRYNDGSRLLARLLSGDSLEAGNTFCLVLEEGLV